MQDTKMENTMIKLYTSDFIYNAGLVGLIRMMQNSGAKADIDYKIEHNMLKVSKEYLLSHDLAQDYIDAHIKRFEESSAYTRLLVEEVENIGSLTRQYAANASGDIKKKLNDKYKFVLDNSGLTRASYLTACKMLHDKGIKIDLKEECKKIKSEADYQQKYQLLLRLKEKMNGSACREIFLMKDIMYSRISAIWQGKAFLLRANAQKDIKSIYQKDFIEPLQKYLAERPKEKKNSRYCIVCDEILAKAIDISFLNDSADDMTRKKSAFWDYKPDAYLCPVCNFIYGLAPLGFTVMGRDLLFVNNNADLINLLRINDNISAVLDLKNDEGDNIWFRIWNEVVQQIIRQKMAVHDNIQVVVREKDREKYNFNVIGKDILELLEQAMKYLEKIGKVSIQLYPPDYFNVQKAVLRNIFNRSSQYGLINKILRWSLQENKQTGYLYNVLMIQQKMTGGDNVESEKSKMFYVHRLFEEGQTLRAFLAGDRGGSADTDNKLRGFIFQLLNALQINDDNQFWQVVLKTYAGYGRPVPKEFLKGFAGSDAFQQLGYAYILGLKSSKKEMDNEVMKGDK